MPRIPADDSDAGSGGSVDYTRITPRLQHGAFDAPLTPLEVEDIERDTTGNKSTAIDQCGNQQTERNGNFGVTISMTGVLSIDQYKKLDASDKLDRELQLTSSLHNGPMLIDSFTATRVDGSEVGNFQNVGDVAITGFKLDLKSPGATEE